MLAAGTPAHIVNTTSMAGMCTNAFSGPVHGVEVRGAGRDRVPRPRPARRSARRSRCRRSFRPRSRRASRRRAATDPTSLAAARSDDARVRRAGADRSHDDARRAARRGRGDHPRRDPHRAVPRADQAELRDTAARSASTRSSSASSRRCPTSTSTRPLAVSVGLPYGAARRRASVGAGRRRMPHRAVYKTTTAEFLDAFYSGASRSRDEAFADASALLESDASLVEAARELETAGSAAWSSARPIRPIAARGGFTSPTRRSRWSRNCGRSPTR